LVSSAPGTRLPAGSHRTCRGSADRVRAGLAEKCAIRHGRRQGRQTRPPANPRLPSVPRIDCDGVSGAPGSLRASRSAPPRQRPWIVRLVARPATRRPTASQQPRDRHAANALFICIRRPASPPYVTSWRTRNIPVAGRYTSTVRLPLRLQLVYHLPPDTVGTWFVLLDDDLAGMFGFSLEFVGFEVD